MLTNKQLSAIQSIIIRDKGYIHPSKHFHMAFAFSGNKLMAYNHNEFLTSKDCISRSKYSLHAEVSLLKYLLVKNISITNQLRIISTSYNKDHKFRNAKPCKNCCDTLAGYGVSNIFFTDQRGCFQKMKVNHIDAKYSSGDIKKQVHKNADPISMTTHIEMH